MIQNQWDCLVSITRNRDHVSHLRGLWVAAFVNIYKNVLHCSSRRQYETHAKPLFNSMIPAKQELGVNHHWMLFPQTKPQAMKFSKAKPSSVSHLATCAGGHGTHRQKELPGWTWRSCAELLSAASHSCISLMQHGFFMAPASFPTAAKYVKEAGRDLSAPSVAQGGHVLRVSAAALLSLLLCLTRLVFINVKKFVYQSHAVLFPSSVLFLCAKAASPATNGPQ